MEKSTCAEIAGAGGESKIEEDDGREAKDCESEEVIQSNIEVLGKIHGRYIYTIISRFILYVLVQLVAFVFPTLTDKMDARGCSSCLGMNKRRRGVKKLSHHQ